MADLDAVAELDASERGRLELVRRRAEKWVAGLTALTGLLASVLVVKGPDSVTELTAGAKAAVGALFAIAFVFLAFATYNGYAAAYGLPGRLDEIDRNPVQGLAGRLSDARRDVAAKAQRAIRDALIATFFAVGLMAGAVAVTWFPPSPASGHVCLSVDGVVRAELVQDHVDVSRIEPGTTVGACK